MKNIIDITALLAARDSICHQGGVPDEVIMTLESAAKLFSDVTGRPIEEVRAWLESIEEEETT